MPEWLNNTLTYNWITILIAAVILGSVIQGVRKGATGSAKQLFLLVAESLISIASLLAAWKLMGVLSPIVKTWLEARQIRVPQQELNFFSQLYYTFVTALRDFSLMRSGILFLLVYAVVKHVLSWIFFGLGLASALLEAPKARKNPSLTSSAVGGALGTVTGAGRALMVVAVLFIYTTLFPSSGFADYVRQSTVYQKGANEVIRPVTGDLLTEGLPIFTKTVQTELNQILQRKYEVLDANVPDDIALAAKEVTVNAHTDEEKARALYRWVGTRIKYDWEKVELYEKRNIWKEQTPEDTFKTRSGVCIDFSRLYAVMAKSVGLQSKVVTGIGLVGNGNSGPHAWNEVYLGEKMVWVPLDSTWVSSGGNWFNPPNFQNTHIREA
jgi:hypothetical protein